jgi:predicted acylesterase/phospholipase RssA
MLLPPKRIVLTGGGLRTLGYFGVLEVLTKKGLLKQVKEYIGVSAGALVGFCAMLGYSIEEMQKVVTEFDFSILQNVHPELMLEFFSQYGVDTGEQLEKFLKSLLRIKGHPIEMTFRQWSASHSVRLRCYATDLNTGKIKEFSLEKTPDISLVFALRTSMSLPLYFVPVKDPETGHLLVDGGLIQNFPMNYLTEEEKETALGISFLYSKDAKEEIPDFVSFLAQLYNCGFNPRTYQVQNENKLRCVIIPTGSMSAYNFQLTKEFREELISLGRVAAEEYCNTYMKQLFEHKRPIRRFSVH